MRISTMVCSAALLGACTSTIVPVPEPTPEAPTEPVSIATDILPVETPDLSIVAPENYDDGWNVSGGWPGEYPPGFSVLEEGVVLQGRTAMHPLTEATIACPVSKLATYQQWNFLRTDADDLDYVVATKLFDITMTSDAPIEVPDDEMGYQAKQLPLKKGDVLTYQRYLGEGYAIISFGGVDYEINEAELVNVSDINEAASADGLVEDLWVEVACGDEAASRAWVLYDEVINTSGIGPTPITGYGESADITEADIAGVREQMEMAAEAGEQ